MSNIWKKRLFTFMRGWGYSIIIALLIATSFKSAIADWNDVPSGSMRPTILDWDRIYVNKLAYDLKLPYTTIHLARWANPKRGDIVVFFSPEDGKRLVKRVIGLPGDTIAMRENRVYINGKLIDYSIPTQEIKNRFRAQLLKGNILFIENLDGRSHSVMFTPLRPSKDSFKPITIPPESYFMLGDNRDQSADSRFFGVVNRSRIVGRAQAVVISRDGSIFRPRWDRWFMGLS